jgi:hypothetical protein
MRSQHDNWDSGLCLLPRGVAPAAVRRKHKSTLLFTDAFIGLSERRVRCLYLSKQFVLVNVTQKQLRYVRVSVFSWLRVCKQCSTPKVLKPHTSARKALSALLDLSFSILPTFIYCFFCSFFVYLTIVSRHWLN